MKGGKSEKKDKRRRIQNWRIRKRDKKEGMAWREKSEEISVEEEEERQETRDKREGIQTVGRGYKEKGEWRQENKDADWGRREKAGGRSRRMEKRGE